MKLQNRIESLENQLTMSKQAQPIYLRRVIVGTDEFIMGVITDNGKTYYSQPKELETDFLKRVNIENYLTEDFDKVRQQMLDDDDC